ncbi:MAG: DMT family transporter [Acidobacteriota bacterium]|nr:DMT family transporter [Acidobacteriota bacterium]
MLWIYLLLALVVGAFMPVQAGVNSQLARWMGHPVLAATISFIVGTLALLIYSLTLRSSWPAWGTLSSAPWWVWTGGFFGAFFVAVAAAFAPKLGAATFVSITIAGQMFVSLVLDQYGLVGFQERPINAWRALGAVLLVVGVALIRKF